MKLEKCPEGARIRILTYIGWDNLVGKVVRNRHDGSLVDVEYPAGSKNINSFIAECDILIEDLS